MKFTLVICLMWLGMTFHVRAAESHDVTMNLVRAALAANESVKLSQWAYTISKVADGEQTVEKHNPSLPKDQRWQLVNKNGKTPTVEDMNDYAGQRRRRRGDDGQQRLRELIDQSTIKLLSNGYTHMTCSVRMKASDEDDKLMAEKMHGTLVIHKDPPYVESLELVNAGRISKFAVLNIKEFKTRLRFQLDPIRNAPLPETVYSRVRGRAILVKSMNADSQSKFSDFRWVGP
jgi:hypothetical protein